MALALAGGACYTSVVQRLLKAGANPGGGCGGASHPPRGGGEL